MKKVKLLDFNWRQVGYVQDRDGAGEDYTRISVGERGVVLIEENESNNGMQLWNYVITYEDGRTARVFNPNFVEYYPIDKTDSNV